MIENVLIVVFTSYTLVVGYVLAKSIYELYKPFMEYLKYGDKGWV